MTVVGVLKDSPPERSRSSFIVSLSTWAALASLLFPVIGTLTAGGVVFAASAVAKTDDEKHRVRGAALIVAAVAIVHVATWWFLLRPSSMSEI